LTGACGVKREKSRSLFIFAGFVLLLLAVAATATVAGVQGFAWEKLPQIWQHAEGDVLAYKIWDVRLPRTVLAMQVGSALAVAGCLLQGITRNPLSDPEIMGVNQGASFFVVGGLLLLGEKDVSTLIMIAAFLGAAVGGSVVYALSFGGDFTPTRLVLAGLAVSFFLGSLTTGLVLLFETTLMEILFWMAGKLSGANWGDVKICLLSLLPTMLFAWSVSNQFNILQLGEEVARGLGQNIVRVRRMAALLIVVLVGGSVAVAGPIGFVGLMVPHMARKLVGEDYRLVLPLSVLIGANLLLLADLGGQFVFYPTETPVGIITALLGTPFFLYLMRRKKGGVE
jgi:ABC-type Fe3+-siderophore transport system permease subunit